MRGHDELIAMRMRHHIPAAVVVSAFRGSGQSLGFDGTTLEVEIPPGDRLQRLDLRFMVGLPVFVVPGTDDEGWAHDVASACVLAGAARVFLDGEKLERMHG